LLVVGWPPGDKHAALVAALTWVLLLGPVARADASDARAKGAYRAPAECPDHDAWRAALHARAGADVAKLSDRLAIEIQRGGGGSSPTYEGRIWESGGATSHEGRQVRGGSCREVFEALALIARLGLARIAAQPPAPSQHRAPVSALPRPSFVWSLTPQQELELARDPEPEAPGPALAPDRVRLTGAALALWGGAAQATADPDLGVALAARWRSARWQPFVLLGAYGGRERFGVSSTSAGARLERLALHTVACPLRFPRESAFGVRPCADLDVGMLRGSGVSVKAARGHTAPWVSTGLQLRAEWSPWGPLELGAMIGGVVALTRPRFYFLPDTTAFQADAAAFRAGATAGVSF
jgi:hypothetical protein